VQQARRRKIVYLVGNAGLCQNPSFRHTTGVPKDGLAPFGILHFSRVEILLLSSCNQEVSEQVFTG
jgi:hypothetical protein